MQGDSGGGSNAWSQQLFMRPFFPAFRYRMPVGGLYLCSASTHPGGGTHGMCGFNAAQRVLGSVTIWESRCHGVVARSSGRR